MAKGKIHLTRHGKRELEEELEQLIATRPEMAQRIATAREFGDLSENAEYSAARELQNRTESRIREIQTILENCSIIKSTSDGKVGLGDTVIVTDGAKKREFKVVSAVEADPGNGKISDKSPLGEQLIGKKVGDQVSIAAPRSKKVYEIVEINHDL
ncbi:transcription elongation factor GreA [Candidatus Saccharibacteria bacterium]|nr:transcription elongation factor GreA [Candidatus Saccharibacteria bacterium]MCL1963178.1 transcription elongation factor GreA [Candidatus Saccharibacteria bacterium]